MTPYRSLHVVVLGVGISGLTSAVLLRRAGHSVTIVSADPVEATTSHLAAAVWFPTAAGPAEAVLRWGRRSFDTFAGLARQGRPGVVMRESLTLYRADPGEPDWAAAVGEVRPATPAELPPGYTHGLRFVVPLVEMPTYLPDLLREAVDGGCEVGYRRVTGLSDLLPLRPDVVVNAAGLAAGTLAGDDSMYPVRGQIVRVPNPGLTMSVRDEAHPAGRAYVHPRSEDVILGGTLDIDAWDTTPDLDRTASILCRCADIVPALAGIEPLETVVGLRPGRAEIRVETDTSSLPVPVVHNYGHGGSGITVGWGCAADVVDLVGHLR